MNHNLVFVPNSKLGQANVTNFNLPERKMSSSITVRVAYGTDAVQVERVLLEEARDVSGLVSEDPVTVLWIPGFTDSALVLSLNYTIADFVSQYGVQSELRRKIYGRMAREGISLAAPTQIVG